MNRDLARYAPLTGVAFVALVVAGFFSAGDTPDPGATGAETVAFYADSEGQGFASVFLVALGAVFLLFFASILRSVFRRADERVDRVDRVAAVIFGAGVVTAAGFMVDSAIHFALVDAAEELDPAAAQALNALWGGFFIPFAIGLVTMVLAAGIATIMTRALPVWLGWITLPIFAVAFTPIGWIGMIAAALWVLVVSVLLTGRPSRPAGGDARIPRPASAAQHRVPSG